MPTLNFGKYKNRELEDILIADRNYLTWLYQQKTRGSDDVRTWLDQQFKDADTSYELTWGKHKGKTINWVYRNDIGYFVWLSKSEYVADKLPRLYAEINAKLEPSKLATRQGTCLETKV